jgi:glucose/arabinose dehydrogenase
MRLRSGLYVCILGGIFQAAAAQDQQAVRSGAAAFGSWHDDAPGVTRKFSVDDLKAPKAGTDLEKPDDSYHAKIAPRPDKALPQVPPGFSVELFAQGLKQPRVLRVAPNGDLFLAETGSGRILVYKADANGKPDGTHAYEFASGLTKPFGIAFYPRGAAPQFVYVGEPDRVERFPYHSGDLKAAAASVVVVSGIPSEHHWTRDLAVSAQGKLFLTVGSGSNEGGGMSNKSIADARGFDAEHGLGAAWDKEDMRAAVWTFNMDGSDKKVYAHGLRNCTGLAFQPGNEALWCVVNERDALGDDVPFEYATTVKEGAFYGWPWYYNGAHEDPRRRDQRADLKDQVTVGDVLIQPHSAPLSIAFYDGTQFPAEYRGNAFVTLHGSWNRANRTGYKVVRLLIKDGKPTGEYADFMTGFVADDEHVWGRPVGITVTRDGSLIVSEDGNGTLWRVSAKQ